MDLNTLSFTTLLNRNLTHISPHKITTVSTFILVLYLGLSVLKMMIDNNPGLIQTYKGRIIVCFNSKDITIKKQALWLLSSLATLHTAKEIVSEILE